MNRCFSAVLLLAGTCWGQGQLVVSQRTAAGRAAETVYTPPARIPSGDVASGLQWEGFNSNNYLVLAQEGVAAPNPDIAVGPNDILIVADRSIARLPNINSSEMRAPFPTGSIYAPGPNSLGLRTGGPGFTGGSGSLGSLNAPGTPITNRARLDAWLGASITASVCPTVPRTTISCVLGNLTVRYDQMHGRFLVLATAVDTGITSFGAAPTAPRRAGWVLLVSRFAIVTHPAGSTGEGSPSTAFGTSDTFITVSTNAPSGGAVTGGPNDNIWMAWYGSDIENGGYATDGFGGPFGNLNAISTLSDTVTPPGVVVAEAGRSGTAPYPNPPRRIYSESPANTIFSSPSERAVRFDCTALAIVNFPVTNGTSSYCYFPTDARLGVDNDNLILVSHVYNANVRNPGNGSGVLNQPGQPGDVSPVDNTLYRAYAGARIRVLKKTAIYTGRGTPAKSLTGGSQLIIDGSMAPGSSYFSGPVTQAATSGDFYDLYSVTDQRTPFSFLAYDPGQPILLLAPFTLLSERGAMIDPIFWEPAHVRGRAFAYYSNGLYRNPAIAANYLVGARNLPFRPAHMDNNELFVQGIQYLKAPSVPGFVPRLHSTAGGFGTNAATGIRATWYNMLVDPYTNAANVPQSGTDALLNVGDSRAARVIFREGHLYVARSGAYPLEFIVAPNGVTQSQGLESTVFYHIIQKTAPDNPPLTIVSTRWRNSLAFAPMFDVMANVIRQTPISPINLFAFLEKLFVGTMNSAGANPNLACVAPNPSAPGSITANTLFYPGLYDIKCGAASFVTLQRFYNPVTGRPETRAAARQATATGNPHGDQNTNLFGLRNGAGIDPNDGSLWVYGAYSGYPFDSILGAGQWGTFGANYKMSFPQSEPYGAFTTFISDVQPPVCATPPLANIACSASGTPGVQPRHIFEAVQLLRTHGLANFAATGPASLEDPATFGPDVPVTRGQMARLVLLSMMDSTDLDSFLAGNPVSSFSDVSPGHPLYRYIEAMFRLGITRGCGTSNDARRRFCPERWMTRGEMSVFIIRTKMNNVFPTLLNGCPATPAGLPACPGSPGVPFTGDNFGYFIQNAPYFADVPATLSQGVQNDFFIYIQKMFELKITNGMGLNAAQQRLYGMGEVPPFENNTRDGTVPVDPASVQLNRGALAAFMVRAFFY